VPGKIKLKSFILISGYVIVVSIVVLVALEFTARALGLGDPILYYNSPFGGLRPLPDQKVSRLADASVTIDSNGFRSTGSDSENAIRVLYLGDSVTWGGSSVDDSELFSEVAAGVLRSEGMAVYAMNAGVNGTSLVNQAEIFVQWKDSVDVIVWLFPWNDVRRTYVTAGYLWPPTKRPRFALVEVIDHLIRTRWLPAFRQDPAVSGAEFMLPETPAGYEQFFASILEERTRENIQALLTTVELGRHEGIPVIVGITPRRDDKQLLPDPPEALETLQALESINSTVMKVRGVFPAGTNLERAFIDPVHFTSYGHQLVGEALGDILLSELSKADGQ
jgi:lysophospholipase L1-like esterase